MKMVLGRVKPGLSRKILLGDNNDASEKAARLKKGGGGRK